MRLLQIPLEGAIDQTHLTRVFKAAYDVLYTYMIGNSRKNALYFAKYIDFFQTQISVKVSSVNCSVKLWILTQGLYSKIYLVDIFSEVCTFMLGQWIWMV